MESDSMKVCAVLLTVSLALVGGCPPGTPTPAPNGSPTGTAPVAEYGDAPDAAGTGYPTGFAQVGQFPTLFSSDGARALSADDAVLGLMASVEEDADDAGDPDGAPNLVNADSDDGISNLALVLTSIPPPATLSVLVTAPAGSSGGTYYLNTLIDLNMDGAWGGAAGGGEPEWVVQNLAVAVTPGETITVDSPQFAFANGLMLPDGAWMRIALTSEQVTADDWDGSGEFSSGEIEDHVIELPEKPVLNVACTPSGRITVPPPPPALPIACTVTNVHPTVGGTFDWTLARTRGFGIAMEDPTTTPATTSEIELSGNNVAIAAAGPGGGAPGSVVSVPAGVAAPPGGPSFNALLSGGPLPLTGCAWKLSAFPDPQAVITDAGVILGHGEASCEIEFFPEEADDGEGDGGDDGEGEGDAPVIGLNGATELLEVHHEHYLETSPCVEVIAEITITNAGGGTLAWSIDPEAVLADWLTVTPTSGTAPSTITLTFDCMEVYTQSGLNTFFIVGADPKSGEPATNEPVVSVTYEAIY